MKTKCMSCGGLTTTKMQNGGLITGAKKVPKQGPIKTINTIRKGLKKLTPRKTVPGCFGANCGKMQNGGMIPRCPGPNCPKRPKNGITKAIKKIVKKTRTIGRNGTKQTDTPFGNFLKDSRVMSQPEPKKMQNGGFIGGTSVGKGRNITEKAAARKVGKGKGMMTYKYGNTDAPGTGNNKGAYVKFAKDQEPNPYGAKTFKGRPRSVMQKGGVKK
jgi:hypothetical protein